MAVWHSGSMAVCLGIGYRFQRILNIEIVLFIPGAKKWICDGFDFGTEALENLNPLGTIEVLLVARPSVPFVSTHSQSKFSVVSSSVLQ